MLNGGLIPSIQLEATAVGRQRWQEAWREVVRPFYDIEPASGLAEGEGSARAWLVDNLIFTHVAYSHQSFSHRSSHAENAGYLMLRIYRQGGSRGFAAGECFRSAPGEVEIFDFSREYYATAEKSAVSGVIIPHQAIGYDPGRHSAHMLFSGSSSVGRFLLDAFFAVMERLPGLRQDEASDLASAFCGLVRAVVTPGQPLEPRTQQLRAERRAEMRSYLDRHLAEPNLGIEDLRRAFGVSKPSIYRDFADTGGVSQYIMNRRLDHAMHQLLRSSPGRGVVQEIGSDWGFDDPGYFSKLFRRRFGFPPSTALSMSPADATSTALRGPASEDRGGRASVGEWLKAI